MQYLKKLYKKAVGLHGKMKGKLVLKNKDFSIISDNCWGSFVYQEYGLEYKTPFVGLFLFCADYMKLLKNFDHYIEMPLTFITAEESKYKLRLIELGIFGQYPIGVIGENVEIHFLHYPFEQEAYEKWTKRVKRINKNNMIVKFHYTRQCTDEMIKEFDQLPFEHKICFTHKDFPECKSVVSFKEFEGDGKVDEEWKYYKKYFDITRFLNQLPVLTTKKNITI